jgi:hypothetical protein
MTLSGEILSESCQSMLVHLLRHSRQDHKVKEGQDGDHQHYVEDRQLVMIPGLNEPMHGSVLSRDGSKDTDPVRKAACLTANPRVQSAIKQDYGSPTQSTNSQFLMASSVDEAKNSLHVFRVIDTLISIVCSCPGRGCTSGRLSTGIHIRVDAKEHALASALTGAKCATSRA